MANNNKFRIPLEDVESEHCALIVDNGLAKLNGVESHRVELNNKEAVIETQNRETVSEAVKTIQDLGYGVPTVKISFPVLQMTCASCAVSVESMLKSQAVVVNASVNYANAEVSVEFIPSLIQVESLRKVVQSIGYNLLLDESTSGDGTIEHIQKENLLGVDTIHSSSNNRNVLYEYALCQPNNVGFKYPSIILVRERFLHQ